MPMMLFWLPTIFIGAFFELARIACESTELALSGGAMLPGDPLSVDASRNDYSVATGEITLSDQRQPPCL